MYVQEIAIFERENHIANVRNMVKRNRARHFYLTRLNDSDFIQVTEFVMMSD